jgi:hypothetical protein
MLKYILSIKSKSRCYKSFLNPYIKQTTWLDGYLRAHSKTLQMKHLCFVSLPEKGSSDDHMLS